MSTTKLTMTIGVFPPGKTPLFTTRTINYTDLSLAYSALTSVLTTPPFLQYIPEPVPDPIEEEPL